MKKKHSLNRREFVSLAATAAAATIVPRHVLGGPGFVPPSDKITIANIGCGTQGLREMGSLLSNPQVQVVAVCDPNRFSMGYLDWSPSGLLNDIRGTLGDKTWGADVKGIPGGRDMGQAYVEKYYGSNMPSGSYRGCPAYEDFRELLDREKDLDAIKIMTPDHLHATIAIAAMKKGKHVVTHKPIANRIREGKLVVETARKTGAITHLLAWSRRPEYDLIKQWIDDGVIGELREIHNWSYRPVWPQWTSNPTDTPPVPEGLNWDLWLGPVPDRPYHPNYTNNVFRGWYDFGGGSIADMGHYSLFPLFLTLGIDRAPVAAKSFGTVTRTAVDGVCRPVVNKVAFPYSCMIQLKFPEQRSLPAFDLYWYDGGMKPFPPPELEADGRDTPEEGLMFVGTKGKILGGFRGENPEIIPASAMTAYPGKKTLDKDPDRGRDEWVQAILDKKESPGSFQNAATITETINLAAIALRAGKRIEYDSDKTLITNDEEANQYLTREYRRGWEL
ncbi:MAG: Gfo/Idh/MocA family oxidoreductase [Lewinellaceae bacterium]|nr:Gfo/Idh/MocA family oxidoreductase [Lewinellaceae bacterium]